MLLRYLGRWLDARDQHMAARGEYTYQGHQEASMENTSPRGPCLHLRAGADVQVQICQA